MKNFTAFEGKDPSSTFIQSGTFLTLPVDLVVLLLAVNIFLSITASLGNTSILIALHKVSSYQQNCCFAA